MSDSRLADILEASSRDHAHLCPRQILGARIGLAGLAALGCQRPLVIVESDGCFLDGVSAATGCTPGHRTLRIVDDGKTAALFVDTATSRAVRVAPVPDLRDRAGAFAPFEPRRYFAQMQAYQVMPAAEMLTVTAVRLKTPVAAILSRPRVRSVCPGCGEEVMNERTVEQDGLQVCHACAHGPYYTALAPERPFGACG